MIENYKSLHHCNKILHAQDVMQELCIVKLDHGIQVSSTEVVRPTGKSTAYSEGKSNTYVEYLIIKTRHYCMQVVYQYN